MIGFEVVVKEEINRPSKLLETLLSIFSQIDNSTICYAYDYELVDCGENREIEIDNPLSPSEVANLICKEETLLTCGRLFYYPQNNSGGALDDFSSFWNSTCETVILIYDVDFIEVYSKNQSFMERCIQSLELVSDEIDVLPIESPRCTRTTLRI